MKSIKVPAAIMDVFYESIACEQLAKDSGFLKAIYYKHRAVKADLIAWRAMFAAHPETKVGVWVLDNTAGTVTKEDEPVATPKEKKQRKPKAPAAPETTTTTTQPQGVSK